MNKNLVLVIVGAVLGVALLVGGYSLKTAVPKDLGATPGNIVEGNYFTIGGVDYFHYKVPITASSTVLCYVPPNRFGKATSTLERASINPTTNGLGAITFDLATTTSAGGWATTSPALTRGFSLAVAPVMPFVWALASTTNTQTIGLLTGANGFDGSVSGAFIRPDEGITFRVATATPGTYTSFLAGTCEVTLRKL